MIDFDAARTQLQDRVDEKNARLAAPAVEGGKPQCAHEWQYFRETIAPERSRKAERYGYHYTKGNAYFKVKACPGCRSKKRVELVVES